MRQSGLYIIQAGGPRLNGRALFAEDCLWNMYGMQVAVKGYRTVCYAVYSHQA